MPAHQKKKLTCKHKTFLIKDEAKASKEYAALGWPTLAEQEAKHKQFIKKQPCI